MKYLALFLLLLIVAACTQTKLPDKEALIKEIKMVEQEFNDMAAKEGIASAFIHFADENATLMRGKTLVTGKKAIEDMLSAPGSGQGNLIWSPDFIDVAESGDLAYTYGKYVYILVTEDGDTINDTGAFHTVWKRQEDGSWKYVWD